MSDNNEYQSATYGPSIPPSEQRRECGCEANRKARVEAAQAAARGRSGADLSGMFEGPQRLSDIGPQVPEMTDTGEAFAKVLQGKYGVAQQLRAPGKMFSRSEILAILRAQRGVAGNVADAEYGKLVSIFESIE